MELYPSISDRLKTQHLALLHIISGIGDDILMAEKIPGKWSIKDNISHLARYQYVFLDRVNQMIHSELLIFEPYKAENDPEFEVWREKDIKTLTNHLEAERKHIYETITEFSHTDLNKTGIHRKYGRMNIIQWTEFFLLHEAHHLFTIFQLAHS